MEEKTFKEKLRENADIIGVTLDNTMLNQLYNYKNQNCLC